MKSLLSLVAAGATALLAATAAAQAPAAKGVTMVTGLLG